MASAAAQVERKAPILSVMFIHESGYVESWKPAEIRENPDGFRDTLAEHREAGRRPLVMRAKPRELAAVA